jgi:hypothetical protein
MQPEDRIRGLINESGVVTGPESDERILGDALKHLEQRKPPDRIAAQPNVWSLIGKFAVAAMIVVAALFGIHQITASGIAWADVAERFRTVPFFSVSIYIKDDVTSEPKQMELWMSRTGKTRLRVGTQVVFGSHDEIAGAFDIKTRARTEADEQAVFLLRKVGEADEFSLDAIIRVMFEGTMQDVTPLVNPDAVISQDIVVFDIDLPGSAEWVRIWALRESRLPVRIRVWDPRDGDSTDAIFEYSKEQADEFFDPNAFENLLSTGRANSRVNLAYAFLKDPGGKTITPEDMFARTGYHMPQVKQVGMTPEGAVWIIADRGRNRTANGYHFSGFSQIEDDLGREYGRRVYASHRTATDQSMDVFVPIDYPFDKRTPKKITLTCRNDHPPHIEQEIVGTIDLTEWEQNRLWPEGTISSSEQQLAITLAWRHCRASRNDKVERILATIEGEPEETPAALDRERIHLRMLLNRDKTDEALALARRLVPLLERDYPNWKGFGPTPSVFTDCILALACAGKIDEVKQTWQRIKSIQPRLHPELTGAARKSVEEGIRRSFNNCLRLIVPNISRKTHLTVEQLSDIFDIDIKKSELFKHNVFWDWNPEFEKPEYDGWRRYLHEVSNYYKSHPLPETVELLPRRTNEDFRFKMYTKVIPDFPDYRVVAQSGALRTRFRHHPLGPGRMRWPDDVGTVEVNHDLVYHKDVPERERYVYLLEQAGLEIAEVIESRNVWVAHYDGRRLRPYTDVKAPISYDGQGEHKTGMAGGRGNFSMATLLDAFVRYQDPNLTATGILVIDETGIRSTPETPGDFKSVAVSGELPIWEGPEALELARKWFEEQFGVTFTEETRTVKTYVVRKREKG